METEKRKKLLPGFIIGAVIAAVIIVIVLIAAAGGTQTVAVKGTHIHSAPLPSAGSRVDAKTDYVQVAESENYRLWYYEPRFSVRLEDKNTGAVIESTVSDEKDDGKNNASWTGYMKSGIVINAIVGTQNTYQADLINVPNEITTSYTDNGIYAVISFKDKYQFEIGVEVTLDGDDLTVRIPDESIKENKDGTYINTISIFPFFGYTYLDEQNGYMLVPDGNGALIYLDNKEGRYSTGFSGLIYGADDGLTSRTAVSTLWEKYETVTDSNSVLAPVFGMAHLDDRAAYLGIVESGDERCSIEVVPNGVMVDYNRCFARFLLRDVFVQPLNQSNSGTVPAVEQDRLHSDLCVRYRLLSGDEADYSGMANAYRSFLLDSGRLVKRDTSYMTRVDLLGTEREEFLMGTAAVTMTTADQAGDILEDLRTAGVQSILTVYKGWQKGGLYNVPITSFRADSHIGGNAALKSLMRDEAQKGSRIYLYDDAVSVNSDTHSTTYNVMKMVNKRTFKNEVNGEVYDTFYYLMPGRTGTNLSRFADAAANAGTGSIALSGMTGTLFSYSSKGSYYSRTDTMDIYEDAAAAAAEKCSLLTETPNAYLWKYSDAFLDMPLSSSDYLYLDRDIPFLSMVLKGIVPTYSEYVNFEANKTENFLRMAESGVYPSFYVAAEDSSKLIYTNSSDLYSLEYSSYRDTIAEYDAALRALAEKTKDSFIVSHEIYDNGLVKVTYDNGTSVYVNYSDTALDGDGISVDAQSYAVTGGE
ncbi:MAG: hypothetical protein K6C13_10365 [Oscillospiraceae bacterium]|nr:hypothetical protein [Oscillospiraceae bacterium]